MHLFIYQAYHFVNYFYVITVKNTASLEMDLKMVVEDIVVEEGIVETIFALKRDCTAVVENFVAMEKI